MSIHDKAAAALTTAYGKQTGVQEALDPAFVAVLIELAVKLIGGCLARRGSSPNQVKQNARERSFGVRLQVRRLVRQELREDYGIGGYARHHGDRIVEALLDAGADAEPADILALAQEG